MKRKIYNVIVGCIFLAVIFSVLIFIFYILQEPIRNILLFVTSSEDDINWELVTRDNYLKIALFLSALGAFVVTYCLFRKKIIFRRPIKRDFSYLQGLVQSDSARAPATSVKDLVKKVAGDINEDAEKVVRDIISSDLEKVVKLLGGKLGENKTVIIKGGWGVGKTTITLLALEQLELAYESDKSNGAHRRYIYEVAFLYVGEIGKFKNAILRSLKDTLCEQDLNTGIEIDKIICNLQKDYLKDLSSSFRISQELSITSESIGRLNFKYERKRKNFEVDIIVDDIDRLPASAMLEIVAFLAVLNQLKFVRVIIPTDIDAVSEQIRKEISYMPETFLAKYLPEQVSVEIRSTYSIAEQIAIEKLKSNRIDNGPSEYCPGWAAILFVLISNRVKTKAREWGRSFKWTTPFVGQQPSELNDELTNSLRRRYLIENRKLSISPLYLQKISDGRDFSSYITSTTLNDGKTKIKDVFNNQYYENCISWVFDFAKNCWGFLNISIRDVVDCLSLLDGIKLSQEDSDAIQFAKVYNHIRRAKIITMAQEGDIASTRKNDEEK